MDLLIFMTDLDFYNDYYEKHSKREMTSQEKKRVLTTLSLIPPEVNSILEVGCGDGRIINPLVNKYEKVCGLDISKESLKQVKGLKIEGNVCDLPFEDNSFDIVLSCEILEHLPFKVYDKALKEIERVANNYILISVPKNEDLNLSKIRCPYCECTFHPYRHIRSFDLHSLNHLFGEFKIFNSKLINIQQYPKSLVRMYGFIKSKDLNFPEEALCPQCGYYESNTRQDHYSRPNKLTKILDMLPYTKNKGGWILVLYKKD